MTDWQYQPASSRRRQLIGLTLALSAVLVAAILLLEAAGCGTLFNPSSERPANAFGRSLLLLMGMTFTVLGALAVTYRSDNRIGWLMQATGIALIITTFFHAYGVCGGQGKLPLTYADESFWLATTIVVLPFLGIISLLLLFPDGRFLSPRWRRVMLLFAIVIVAMEVIGQFVPGLIGEETLVHSVENPFGLEGLRRPGLSSQLYLAGTVLSTALMFMAVFSIVVRWWRSGAETRQQLKWFVFFVATSGVLFFSVELFGALFYPAIFDGWFYLFVLSFFFLGLPLVLVVSVLKYRLYDIDIIIRRTLLYALLTAVLITIYFGVVLLAQSAFVALTGQESPIAIVISTLVIAALFNPLRRWLQAFVDRRFYRRQYDAVQTLEAFAVMARDEVDLEQLSGVLMRSVNETMQPETAVLWLKSANVIFPETDR